jgi:hypothetical protein
MTEITDVPTMRVRLLDWWGDASGTRLLPVLSADGGTYVVNDELVVRIPTSEGASITLRTGSEEGIEGIPPGYLEHAERRCRLFQVTAATEPTPHGDVHVAVPRFTFTHPCRRSGGELREAIAASYRLLTDPSYRHGVTTDYQAPPGSPLAPLVPDPPPWEEVERLVAGDRAGCGYGRGCPNPAEILWREQLGRVRSTCTWHWPGAVAAELTPVVVGVWGGDRWITWQQESEWGLFLRACLMFGAVVDQVPDRPVLPVEQRTDMAASLYDLRDHNVAAVHWALAMTHPGLDHLALAEALAATSDDLLDRGTEALCWVDLEQTGLALAERGQELWAAGDVAGALQSWMVAAEGTGDSIAMGRLAEVAMAGGDRESAFRWWSRSAAAGNAASMTSIGAMYADAGDADQAEPWFERAAALGSPPAMFNLGAMAYRRGKLTAARYWLSKARDHGDPDAAAALAQLPRG